jgi:hypothetical protein
LKAGEFEGDLRDAEEESDVEALRGFIGMS